VCPQLARSHVALEQRLRLLQDDPTHPELHLSGYIIIQAHHVRYPRADTLGLGQLPWLVVECARIVELVFAPGMSRSKETGMKEAGAALSVLLLSGALVAGAQDAAGPSIWSGVFTAAQAKRGNDAYQASCSGCHGSDLRATDAEAVDLTGPAIRAKWNGKTLEDRFETIRDTMPLGNANTLGDKTYMDILAFILQFNDFPPGNQELVPQTAKVIVFVPRP